MTLLDGKIADTDESGRNPQGESVHLAAIRYLLVAVVFVLLAVGIQVILFPTEHSKVTGWVFLLLSTAVMIVTIHGGV